MNTNIHSNETQKNETFYETPQRVINAYNDLGDKGKHKLSVLEVMCLNALLSETLHTHLLFAGKDAANLAEVPLLSSAHHMVKWEWKDETTAIVTFEKDNEAKKRAFIKNLKNGERILID